MTPHPISLPVALLRFKVFKHMFLLPPLGLAGFLSPFWESFLSSHFWGLHPQLLFTSPGAAGLISKGLAFEMHGPSCSSLKTIFFCFLKHRALEEGWRGRNRTAPYSSFSYDEEARKLISHTKALHSRDWKERVAEMAGSCKCPE